MEIGVISYLLRHHGTADAMDFLSGIGYTVTELDFRHADGLTDYHKVDARGAAETRKLCIAHGITPMAYCVGGLSKGRDADFLRNVFEFAKGLEVPVITGVLDPDLLPDLDVLCEEYKIYYAIENHRGNVFEAADTILQALEGHSLYIGANPDTGTLRLPASTRSSRSRSSPGASTTSTSRIPTSANPSATAPSTCLASTRSSSARASTGCSRSNTTSTTGSPTMPCAWRLHTIWATSRGWRRRSKDTPITARGGHEYLATPQLPGATAAVHAGRA